jgi:hypothetical protein
LLRGKGWEEEIRYLDYSDSFKGVFMVKLILYFNCI